MTNSLIVFLTLVLLAGPVAAADVSGVWSLRLMTSDGESAPRVSVKLKQDGDRLTGSCVIGDTDEKFTVVGQVIDEVVTWRCTSKGPVAASFSGTINSTGREMTGSWTTPAPGDGRSKARKARNESDGHRLNRSATASGRPSILRLIQLR